MSVTYDALKEAQGLRQNKFSLALKKSSMETAPAQEDSPVRAEAPALQAPVPQAQVSALRWFLVFLGLLILTVACAAFFMLRNSPASVTAVNPVIKPVEISKPEAQIKPQALSPSTGRSSHHKTKKKRRLFHPVE